MPVSECKTCGNVTTGNAVAWCGQCNNKNGQSVCVKCGLRRNVVFLGSDVWKCKAGHEVRVDTIK